MEESTKEKFQVGIMNINIIISKMYVCCYDSGDVLTISRNGIGYRASNYGSWFSEILKDNYIAVIGMRKKDFEIKTKFEL